MKHNFNKKQLLNILFNSQSFIGCYTCNLNNLNKPFVFSNRHKRTIIDLNFSVNNFRRVFNLLSYFKSSKFLIINEDNNFIFLNKYFNSIKNVTCIETKLNQKFFDTNNFDLIIILSSKNFETIANNSKQRKIPIIAFMGLDKSFKKSLYPIFTNTNNLKSKLVMNFLIYKFLTNQK